MQEEKDGSPLPCCLQQIYQRELQKGGIEWEPRLLV